MHSSDFVYTVHYEVIMVNSSDEIGDGGSLTTKLDRGRHEVYI